MRKTSRRICELRDPALAVAVNWERYRSPEARYCPAGVYEIVGRRRGRAAAADQRAELRALQDLRHQGSGAEHRLGDAGGWRRAELSRRNVTQKISPAARERSRRVSDDGEGDRVASLPLLRRGCARSSSALHIHHISKRRMPTFW